MANRRFANGGFLVLAMILLPSLSLAWSNLAGNNLTQKLIDTNVSLVAFISVSDTTSKNLEPEWERAASEANVPLFSIDCSGEGDPCAGFDVMGYPTIKLFTRQTSVAAYHGPRRSGAIVQFVERLQRPAVSSLGEGDLESFKVVDDVVFIAFLDEEDGRSRDAIAKGVERYRHEFTFGVVTDPNLAEKEGVKPPSVRCHRHRDDVTETFSFEDARTLEAFIIEASRPFIAELTPHNHQRFLDRGWPMVYLFATTPTERRDLAQKLHHFAKSYHDSLTSVVVDPAEFPDLPARLGLQPGRYPAGAVHQLSKDRVFPYPYGRDIGSRELQGWGLDVWQGRIQPWVPGEGEGGEVKDEKDGRKKKKKKKNKKKNNGVGSKRRVEVNRGAGINIKVAGRDEL